MPITTPQGFDLQNREPLELKTKKPSYASLDDLEAIKYDGLTVYVSADQKNYQWITDTPGGDVLTGTWVERVTNVFSISTFINESAGPTSAGLPIVLDADGKIDSSMLTASSLDLYYLLDGSKPLEGAMNADGNKIIGLATGTTASDAVRFDQLTGYLPSGGTAADSARLGGELPAYYLAADNISGTIANANLPSSISSDISGNAATASTFASAMRLTLGNHLSGFVEFDGSTNVTLQATLVSNSHTHTPSDITPTNTAFNRPFTTSGGNNGTSSDVARGNHTHPGSVLLTKIIDIGDWDMDSTADVDITHGLDYSDIRSVSALIRKDLILSATTLYNFSNPVTNSALDSETSIHITSTEVTLRRHDSGFFDSGFFDDTSWNRGWIVIGYVS